MPNTAENLRKSSIICKETAKNLSKSHICPNKLQNILTPYPLSLIASYYTCNQA